MGFVLTILQQLLKVTQILVMYSELQTVKCQNKLFNVRHERNSVMTLFLTRFRGRKIALQY